uniref:Uncharacterized protein n=1 Tax=Anguilla anguilla TaxID=7936 RepID=A0A0E9Q7M9_ANGAN
MDPRPQSGNMSNSTETRDILPSCETTWNEVTRARERGH